MNCEGGDKMIRRVFLQLLGLAPIVVPSLARALPESAPAPSSVYQLIVVPGTETVHGKLARNSIFSYYHCKELCEFVLSPRGVEGFWFYAGNLVSSPSMLVRIRAFNGEEHTVDLRPYLPVLGRRRVSVGLVEEREISPAVWSLPTKEVGM
jgi:hypothetical protein